MSNLKVQGYNNLEKDPTSGAVILNEYSNRDIRLNNLDLRVRKIEKKVDEILNLLREIASK